MLTSVTTKSIKIQLSCFVKNLDIEPVAEMIVSVRNGHSAIGDCIENNSRNVLFVFVYIYI